MRVNLLGPLNNKKGQKYIDAKTPYALSVGVPHGAIVNFSPEPD